MAIAPQFFTNLGAGLLSGNSWNEQGANAIMGGQVALNDEKAKQDAANAKNQTVQMLAAKAPDLAAAVQTGAIDGKTAFAMMLKRQADAAEAAKPKWTTQVINGKLVRVDANKGTVDQLGDYSSPDDNAPAAAKENKYWLNHPDEYTSYQQRRMDEQKTLKGGDDFEQRKKIADDMGIKPDDPSYKTYVMTGKMPREDQQSLTAVDKKAILDADEMVQINKQAIDALTQAKTMSKSANSGMMAGTRAWAGANLPDWMVPDQVSSPDSSTSTMDYDNAVIGQALGQLKAIFGGAPTEGERKILLDLQGSSNMPVDVRNRVLDRALEMAQHRLDFNKDRADQLRGSTYYKPQQPNNNPSVEDLVKKYGG